MVIKKLTYIVLGSICVALGATGVIVPLLPTTPFLLLAGYFYIRSSKRLYHWLINHKLFGLYIYNYLTYKAIDMKSKVGLITLLWLSMGSSMYIMKNIYITILLVFIGLCVSAHIILLRTLKKAEMQANHHKVVPVIKHTKNALS